LKNFLLIALFVSLLAIPAEARYPVFECFDCYDSRGESTDAYHLGITASALIGTGPFGLDVIGSVVELQSNDIYRITNFREEFDYLWGFEAGGFLRLPKGERIEILTTFAKTNLGLIATYSENQTDDSLMTYRKDSLHIMITEITPKLRLSAAMPYGLEPYIGVGLMADIFEIDETYRVNGIYYDQLGGGLEASLGNSSKISLSGLELLLGTKVRITDYLAFHLDASGVFMPNKNITLGEINNTVAATDRYGNPREPQEISVIPREHRLRLTHATIRFGAEISFYMISL
jgi:hypothetical protein